MAIISPDFLLVGQLCILSTDVIEKRVNKCIAVGGKHILRLFSQLLLYLALRTIFEMCVI
jgi:hypothetical protein